MATIPGAHLFAGTAPGFAGFTATDTFDGVTDARGNSLAVDTVAGAFNLEVFIGSVGAQPAMAPGFQGLAVQSPGGAQIDLIDGAYAVSDPLPGGNDTINAHGANETVQGSPADTLTLYGTNETAIGDGGDAIAVWGSGDRVDDASLGAGGNTVTVFGMGNTIAGGNDEMRLLLCGFLGDRGGRRRHDQRVRRGRHDRRRCVGTVYDNHCLWLELDAFDRREHCRSARRQHLQPAGHRQYDRRHGRALHRHGHRLFRPGRRYDLLSAGAAITVASSAQITVPGHAGHPIAPLDDPAQGRDPPRSGLLQLGRRPASQWSPATTPRVLPASPPFTPQRLRRIDQRAADRRHRADCARPRRRPSTPSGLVLGQHRIALAMDGAELSARGIAAIHERAGQKLARLRVEADVFEQQLPDTLGDAADDLSFEQQRVHHKADIVDDIVAAEFDDARVGVDLQLADMAAIREALVAGRIGRLRARPGSAPGGRLRGSHAAAAISESGSVRSVPAILKMPASNSTSASAASSMCAAMVRALATIFSVASMTAEPPSVAEREPPVPSPIATRLVSPGYRSPGRGACRMVAEQLLEDGLVPHALGDRAGEQRRRAAFVEAHSAASNRRRRRVRSC